MNHRRRLPPRPATGEVIVGPGYEFRREDERVHGHEPPMPEVELTAAGPGITDREFRPEDERVYGGRTRPASPPASRWRRGSVVAILVGCAAVVGLAIWLNCPQTTRPDGPAPEVARRENRILPGGGITNGPAVALAGGRDGAVTDGQSFAVGCEVQTYRTRGWLFRIDAAGALLLGRFDAQAGKIRVAADGRYGPVDEPVTELFVLILADADAVAAERIEALLLSRDDRQAMQDATPENRGRVVARTIHDAFTGERPAFWTGSVDDILLVGAVPHDDAP